jgi:hypothetical protein
MGNTPTNPNTDLGISTAQTVQSSLSASDVTGQMSQALDTLVRYTNLANAPWWQIGFTGNPTLKRLKSPVTFQVCLDSTKPSVMLPNSLANQSPLTVKLNCSLNQVSHQMKHIINKANTRSGVHLTFWGMEPDIITGSGSTGLFMNRYGITEIMSLENNTDALEDSIDKSAYGQSSPNSYGYPYTGPDASPIALEKLRGMYYNHRFRVAAQDAFIELLSLFKNNGVTRFVATDSDSPFNNRTQLSPTIWSAQYGSNTFQRNARNNDVMVKGQVIMNFKGNVYQGYFKSLTWTMDANSPYQWKFDFIFQVERAINYVFYTQSSAAAQAASNAAFNARVTGAANSLSASGAVGSQELVG